MIDRIRAARNVALTLPAQLTGERRQARLVSYDAPPQMAPITVDGEAATIILPTQCLWTLVVLE